MLSAMSVLIEPRGIEPKRVWTQSPLPPGSKSLALTSPKSRDAGRFPNRHLTVPEVFRPRVGRKNARAKKGSSQNGLSQNGLSQNGPSQWLGPKLSTGPSISPVLVRLNGSNIFHFDVQILFEFIFGFISRNRTRSKSARPEGAAARGEELQYLPSQNALRTNEGRC